MTYLVAYYFACWAFGITAWFAVWAASYARSLRAFAAFVSIAILSIGGAVSVKFIGDHATGQITYELRDQGDGSRSWVRVRVTPATPVERSEP